MKKTIFIIRHGETEFNKLGIVQGSGVDSSLNQVGQMQAAAFHKAYQSEDFDLVITSALKRTQETVKPFTDAGLPWIKDPDINEICWGVHEGKSATPEMREAYVKMRGQWIAGNLDACLEGGESAKELAERLSRFIENLKARPEEKILVCSHGRAMRCLVALMKKVEMAEMENVKHANTGLFLANFDDNDFQFTLENDITHLEQIKKYSKK